MGQKNEFLPYAHVMAVLKATPAARALADAHLAAFLKTLNGASLIQHVDDPEGGWYARTMQDHILQFFTYQHLPDHLAAVAKPFADLAHAIVGAEGHTEGAPAFPLPHNPERDVALRKLLEAKDAAVRAALAK